ncbi:DUF2515 family protein [Fictibacillus fluitans]|uniref:DUF2515 family protein n=1 Tax=Fictibacillus fluitans TaxID=3058422 RepID=A0ABT8HR13_9BACL|nr:DUF2515 family protein [Fictibacillus sp. NE201]MDN4523195.1 DUF2515 family protein [Fictibacillus sp. NE201]
MKNRRLNRTLSKAFLIPSALTARFFKRFKPSAEECFWKMSPEDKNWLSSRIKMNDCDGSVPVYIGDEKKIIERILRETSQCNQNNITRTKAYYRYFKQHQELHWAFLAHMVSRNAGYHMTDLQGEFLKRLLTTEQRKKIYWTLEIANSLIFQDVYPQLLLYEQSKRVGKSLFHLLNGFNVSAFMRHVWEHFLWKKDSRLITLALIINEQNVIEREVVQKDIHKEVFKSLPFQLQNLFQLTKILFPVFGEKSRMAGLSVTGFHDLAKRIKMGKRLYRLLFQEKIFSGVLQFADRQRHTGSRADYWGHVFSQDPKVFLPHYKKERIRLFSLKRKAFRFYSPELLSCWDVFYCSSHHKEDWFSGTALPPLFDDLFQEKPLFIDRAYWIDLHHLEGAVLAKQLFT